MDLVALESILRAREKHIPRDDSSIHGGSEMSFSGAEDRRRQKDEEKERKSIARLEDKAVRYLRVTVLGVITLTAGLVLSGTFLFTRNDEIDDFEKEFRASANRVVDDFLRAVDIKLGVADAVANSYTSASMKSGSSFPNVTLPDFEIRGDNSRVLADALNFQYQPLVTDETRKGWEAYANANYRWMAQAYESEVEQKSHQDAMYNLTSPGMRQLITEHRSLQYDEGYRPYVWAVSEDGSQGRSPEGSGPYFPAWQMSPVYPPEFLFALNGDMLTNYITREALLSTLETSLASINLFTNIVDDEVFDIFDFILLSSQYRHDVETYQSDPLSAFAYPVFDSFDEDRKVAGIITCALYWRLFFTDILTEKAHVVVVIKNSFNQTISYQVDGPEVTYLGPADYHDTKFDDLEVYTDVYETLESRARPETRSFTAVGLTGDFGRFYLHIYPAEEMEDDFFTPKPMLLTIIVASVFVFTTIIFVLYDCIVARRQRIVLAKAVKSGAIVSSLFPENVRARLFQDEQTENKKKSDDGTWLAKENEAPRGGLMDPQSLVTGGRADKENRPIAEQYEEATILFADLGGFADWSAKREAGHIFELLETLYRAFDALALTMDVFKIETIGDCYLAVTGVPKKQDDHAIIMAKFASEIMSKTTEITQKLVGTLGPETADLELRIGLHSGPVTAGVLRGQKSRFQLFGDSVNTASRIETSGKRGCIHASESTAHELITKGKAAWVVPRNETVVVKGKGELQTYWVKVTKTTKTYDE